MNPFLEKLQPYPFERLRALLKGVTASARHSPIAMSIGEPTHPAPQLVKDALVANLAGLSGYPPTAGGDDLRRAIADWLQQRHGLGRVDPATEVLPVNGSKEALFAIAQAMVGTPAGDERPCVLLPNPCYQVYEGAALLAGAEAGYIEQHPRNGFRPDWDAISPDVWRRTQLVYLCSPGNPTGNVITDADWLRLFELSDRHGFIIAADECYSEIHFDDRAPPRGALAVAQAAGRTDWRRLLVFSSLSKRSSVPGLRSGFVAGDASLIRQFLRYRTYNGGAMSATVQAASAAAWRDEGHVGQNRALYRAKFERILPILQSVLDVGRPEGGFFLWAAVPDGVDTGFARDLYEQYNVLVVPGSFLGRSVAGRNPGAGFIRIALVDDVEACAEAAERIRDFVLGRHAG